MNISSFHELSKEMDQAEEWFTMAMYTVFGVGLIIIFCLIYKILCCGVCIINGVFSPCKCLFRCCRKEKKEPLLRGDPITRS